MTHPTDPSVIARGLSEAQRKIVERPVNGVISGQFFVSDTPRPLDELHALALCRPRFEPSDFASRGYRHAAACIPLGEQVRDYLLSQQGEKP